MYVVIIIKKHVNKKEFQASYVTIINSTINCTCIVKTITNI